MKKFLALIFLLLAAAPLCATTVTVGARETILDTGTKPDGWPDGTLGVLRSGSDYILYGATGNGHFSPEGAIRKTVGTLANPLATSNTTRAIGSMKDTFNYVGGGPVYDAGGGLLLMFYHIEKWPGGNGARFYAETGMAKSTDAGSTWTDLGVILTHQSPYDSGCASDACSADIGSGSFLVIGGYLYVYFQNRVGVLTDFNFVNLSVARALVTDVVAAANAGNVTTFQKYCSGSVAVGTYSGTCTASGSPWGEPGLGGLSSPLEAGNPDQVVNPTPTFNSYVGKYILIAMVGAPGFSWPITDLIYMESTDGIVWTGRQTIVHENNTIAFYPTTLSLGSDPAITSKDFYVYYDYQTAGNNIGAGPLVRRTVTLLNQSSVSIGGLVKIGGTTKMGN